MASVINSLRSIASDSWWLVKLSFFAAVLFVVMDNDLNYPNGNPNLVPVYFAIFMLMLGSASVAMHRNIKNLTPLFPSFFNIIEVVIKSIGATLAFLPGALLYYVAISFIKTNLVFETFIMALIYIIVTSILAPFIVIPVVLYSVRGNLLDAFNLKNVNGGAGNYVVNFLSYVIQYIFTIGLFTFLVYTVLLEMLGDNVGLLILKCILIVVSFFSFFIFSSDLYEDVIPVIKEKPKKKLKRKVL